MPTRTDPPHRQLWSGLASTDQGADIGVLGIPTDGAASFRKGAAKAPQRIRSLTPHVAPTTERGHSLRGLRIHDARDVDTSGDWESIEACTQQAMHTLLAQPFCLILGGDHSITIPVAREVAGHIEGPMGYMHIDAHLDLMDTFEGLAHSHACTARRVLELPNVSPENTAFLGIRSWLDEEMAFLEAQPDIHVETAATLAEGGLGEAIQRILPRFHEVQSVYVSVDIDVLDPAFAPGTGTPEAGGLSTRELLQLLQALFTNLPIRALDIVEVSPPLDDADITSIAAIKLIYEIFGWVKGRTDVKRASA